MIPTNADFEPLLMAILESPEALSVTTEPRYYRNISAQLNINNEGKVWFEYTSYLGGDNCVNASGSTIEELLNNLKSFDPEAKKKARLAELKKEIEQLEGQNVRMSDGGCETLK